MALSWRASPELDVAGYNVWRATEPGSGWRRLDRRSARNRLARLRHHRRVLWVWASALSTRPTTKARSPTRSAAGRSRSTAASCLSTKPATVQARPVPRATPSRTRSTARCCRATPSPTGTRPLTAYPVPATSGRTRPCVWHADEYTQQLIAPSVPGLANYLEQGGRLLYCGWKPIAGITGSASYPFNFSAGTFAYDRLGIARAEQAAAADFIGGSSLAGYPDIAVDSTKLLAGLHGRMPYVDCLLPGTTEPVLAYRSSLGRHLCRQVGRGTPPHQSGPSGCGRIPIVLTVESTAVAFARRALADLGEPYGAATPCARCITPNASRLHHPWRPQSPVSSFGIRHSEFLSTPLAARVRPPKAPTMSQPCARGVLPEDGRGFP